MPSLVLLMQLATCLLVSFSGSMDDRLTAADGKHRRRALMTLVHVLFLFCFYKAPIYAVVYANVNVDTSDFLGLLNTVRQTGN